MEAKHARAAALESQLRKMQEMHRREHDSLRQRHAREARVRRGVHPGREIMDGVS